MPDNQNADSYPQPIPVINSLNFQSGWQSNPTIETIPLDENLYMPGVNNAGDTLLKTNSLAALRPLLRPELMPTDLGVTYKGYWLLIGSQNFPGGSAGNQTYTQSLTATETSTSTLSRNVEATLSGTGDGITGSVKASITQTTSTTYTTSMTDTTAFEVAPNTTFIEAQWQWCVDVALVLMTSPETPFHFLTNWENALTESGLGPSNTQVSIGSHEWATIHVSTARNTSVTIPT